MDLEGTMPELPLDIAELRSRNPILLQFLQDVSMEHQSPFTGGLLMYRALRTEFLNASRKMPTVSEAVLRARIPSSNAEELLEKLRNENPNAAGLVDIAASHGSSVAESLHTRRATTMVYFLIKDAYEA